MNLKLLDKTELDQRIKLLISKERELLHEILLTIKEIDQRRLYLEYGFANLFLYLVEGVGYSAGSAQRRIDAARLLGEVPSLGSKIQSGEVKLHQVSLIQKAAREVYKTTNKKVSAEEKQELLEQITSKNFQDSQKEVASFFDLPVIEATTQVTQADDSVRLSLTISKELADKIQQAQALLSHAISSNDIVDYLEYVTDRVIKQKTSVKTGVEENNYNDDKSSTLISSHSKKRDSNSLMPILLKEQNPNSSKPTATVAVKPFSARTKKILINQDQCCQYKDPTTGRQCRSRWFLQIDHKLSRWAQGASTLENAQLLCAQHNRLKYQQEAGLKYLSQ
ncbi:HNH endonuclease [Bdellovibrio bacteriovorus]|uniref:HNH endonuclease n=1 Tax=Bdellovibrio bacteriovorus TaxID=959 RepID=UPI0035A88CF6